MVCEQRHAQAIADEQNEINSWKLQLLTVVAKYIVKHIQDILRKKVYLWLVSAVVAGIQ